ncbi:ABC transporter ATP-binding protein [uncultured Propionibacterium sp.]|uniref:ABC transporter ATP-binding protein n=1 Tax=uncultured Propionibacterium sp. TaxID=218066 RepID=UPI00292FD37A|nr:ABC transporter ATP-binding protein [uncultured Propionibacterium sp.]
MIRALSLIAGRGQRNPLGSTIALAVAAAIAQGIAAILIVPTIRALFGSPGRAVRWIIILAIAFVVQAVLLSIATWDGFKGSLRIIDVMHERLGHHLVRLPQNWFDGEAPAKASQVSVSGTMFVATVSMDVIVPLIVNVAVPATIAVGALAIDWRLGLALIASCVIVWISSRLGSWSETHAEEQVRAHQFVTDRRLLEFARNQVALRSAGVSGAGYEPLSSSIEEQRRAMRRAVRASIVGSIAQSIITNCVFGATVSLAVWLLLGGRDAAMMIALIGLVAQFIGPLNLLASFAVTLRKAGEEVDAVQELLDTPVMPESPHPKALPATTDLVFDDVHFGYTTGAPILRGVCARIPANAMTAIVGASGSGKTTMLRLISRFWDVSSGAVKVGDVDVRRVPVDELHQSMSMIFQDVYLFDDTLEANVRFSDPDAPAERVAEAMRLAYVDEIAERLPQGARTRVGEGGLLLSGGERQRVSIARALLRRAPIVLCDEPTSALDWSTRRAVSEALVSLRRDSTVVVIAHELSTIAGADQILVLDRGEIVQRGIHDELLAQGGRYQQFWAERARSASWRIGHHEPSDEQPTDQEEHDDEH